MSRLASVKFLKASVRGEEEMVLYAKRRNFGNIEIEVIRSYAAKIALPKVSPMLTSLC